ncbi:MAG TPA: ABC transporter permease [Candidatus Baltobacteraceae bacterium]|nr:ABC transporter permease [Candidatus Baltobacteraceae bacterium]
MSSAWSLRGFDAVVYKELRQITRSPATLALAILIPTLQMVLLGYAINTTVEHVPAAVYDGDRGRAAEALLDALSGSRSFDIVLKVPNRQALRAAIVAGKVRVGFDIPENFTADLIAGRRPAVGALVDGSDSAIAQVAYASAAAFASIPLRNTTAPATPAFEVRPLVLFNPSLRSADFFVPGLIGLVMQNITVLLTALAIVGERERGTLDQLLVTPIGSAGLMLGKLLPYALVAGADFAALLLTMRFVFGVPIAGNVALLTILSAGFLLTALGLGLLVSTIAQSQLQAMLMAVFLLLPSVLLSGTIFERSLMPVPMQVVAYLIPLTYYIDILRGIILRGAGLGDLWPSVIPLFGYGLLVFAFASVRFARTTR